MRVECEGEGEMNCKGTKQMGQNEWDKVNVGRSDRVSFLPVYSYLVTSLTKNRLIFLRNLHMLRKILDRDFVTSETVYGMY